MFCDNKYVVLEFSRGRKIILALMTAEIIYLQKGGEKMLSFFIVAENFYLEAADTARGIS